MPLHRGRADLHGLRGLLDRASTEEPELDDARADLAREHARRVEADANYSRVSKCAKKLEADLAEATRALEDARAEAKRAKYDAQKARREANRDANAAANAGPNERPDRENPRSNPHSNPAKRAKPGAFRRPRWMPSSSNGTRSPIWKRAVAPS